ncbi:hypothetical protein MesoLj131b_63830 [Mesorhizobium sp. 131-2-5]|nr:hypothetical protein MesoLj131b_63830 [Mesorhizobium sp. 131-2-5]
MSKIPSNDFSLYDHVLDTAAVVGALPSRYARNGGEVPLDIYFAMAHGNQGQTENCDSGQEHAPCPVLLVPVPIASGSPYWLVSPQAAPVAAT